MAERLSRYFDGVASKRLSAVEVNIGRSNQHEFNGTKEMIRLLGADRKKYIADFMYLSDDEASCVECKEKVTWYDAREDTPDRTEYRLYFSDSVVMKQALEGDTLIIGGKVDGTLLIIIAERDSAIELQLRWLFSIQDDTKGFYVKSVDEDIDQVIDFVHERILQSIGIHASNPSGAIERAVLQKYPNGFPSAAEFSKFARSTCHYSISSRKDPDIAVVSWLKREEALFKALEKHQIDERLERGFDDTDAFMSYSMSVHNRRKSRAGRAVENHLEQIFQDYNLRYARNPKTEFRARPDFLFPGIEQYKDPKFLSNCLTMLGVKNTCKDRWRQILTEAERIPRKHLFTLEPGMSEPQTEEIHRHNVALVLPSGLHCTYTKRQQQYLMNLKEFIDRLVLEQANSHDV